MVVGYWLTNVLGFVLMHKGAAKVVQGDAVSTYSRRDLLLDLIISLVYTAIIVALLKAEILQPFQNYLNK